MVVKNLPANAGDARDVGSTPESGRSPGGGNGNPLQYSCLKNLMDRGVWSATVHGVAKSQTRLSTAQQQTTLIMQQTLGQLPGQEQGRVETHFWFPHGALRRGNLHTHSPEGVTGWICTTLCPLPLGSEVVWMEGVGGGTGFHCP